MCRQTLRGTGSQTDRSHADIQVRGALGQRQTRPVRPEVLCRRAARGHQPQRRPRGGHGRVVATVGAAAGRRQEVRVFLTRRLWRPKSRAPSIRVPTFGGASRRI